MKNNIKDPVLDSEDKLLFATEGAVEHLNRENDVQIEKVSPIYYKELLNLAAYSYKVDYKLDGQSKSVYFGTDLPFTKKALKASGMNFVRNRIGVKEGVNRTIVINNLEFFSLVIDWNTAKLRIA